MIIMNHEMIIMNAYIGLSNIKKLQVAVIKNL